MSKQELMQLIAEKRNYYSAISDDIWSFAELRFEEKQSADVLIAALKENGFAVEENVGQVPYAFVGSWGSSGPVIGFLGEFDALSGLSQEAGVAERRAIVPGGNGHGCGHHLLGVGSLAAAIGLKEYARIHKLDVTLKYYGCPGEEGGSGKAFMAREGVFAGMDAALSWHPADTNTLMNGSSLANTQVYFRFTGKASHAGGSPHLGRSALDAMELMNVGVNYMREHMIPDARVHYAIIDGGGKSPNVVQPYAEQIYLIRAPKNEQVQELFRWVIDIARGAALMTQTLMEYEVDKACSNLIPNFVLERLMHANMEEIGAPQPDAESIRFAEQIRATLSPTELVGNDKMLQALYGGPEGRRLAVELGKGPIHTSVLPLRSHEQVMAGSTDVADVSWNVPTVQCTTACEALGTPGHSWQQVAQGTFAQAHTGMIYAAQVMAATALDLLQQPERISEAKAELEERTGPEGYVCPIPAEAKPSPVR